MYLPQSELALCTSDDLIQELLSRMTFVGVLVHSETEAIGTSRHENFMVNCTPNLNPDQVLMILEDLVSQLKKSGI